METITSRVKSILFQPRATWKEIDTEFTKPGELWGKYILPLALIGPVASTIGMILFGQRIAFTSLTNPVPISTAITRGVAAYVLALVSVFIVSKIITALAPGFGGQSNDVQGLKAAAYSSTAVWLGGVFAIHPALSIVWLIALAWTLYLLHTGLPVVMKVPRDRAMGYTAVVIIGYLVVVLITRAILTAF